MQNLRSDEMKIVTFEEMSLVMNRNAAHLLRPRDNQKHEVVIQEELVLRIITIGVL